MRRTRKLNTLEKVNFQNKVPYLQQRFRTAQDTIPVETVFPDGIFYLPKGNYSATFRFTDVNYGVASQEDKKSIFYAWGDLLMGLPVGVSTKVTIFNRKRDKNLMELLKVPEDSKNPVLGKEYNQYLLDLMESGSGIMQDKYITVNATEKKDIREARAYFSQLEGSLTSSFGQIGSTISRLDLSERLRVFHDFYRFGTEDRYDAVLETVKERSFKDVIAPMGMGHNKDFMEVGPLYARAMFLSDYGGFVVDKMISELCALERPMMLSIDIVPVPLQESVEEAQRRFDATEAEVSKYLRKNKGGILPEILERQRRKAKEVLHDLMEQGQGMAAITVTLVHLAESKEQLDIDTETLQNICTQRHCRLDTLYNQQIDGMNTVLPYGQTFVPFDYLMTTDPAAALMPFSSQEVCDRTGIPYGRQAVSGNILVADRLLQVNGNAFILGVPGSGKSFIAKKELLSLRLKYGDNVDILIIDPQGEYIRLADSMDGSVINIASGGVSYLNAMDMDKAYDDKNPLALKSEFLITLIEQMMGEAGLTTKARSVLDHCISLTYHNYIKNGYQGTPPTLVDLSEVLKAKGGAVGQEIAQSMAIYTTGTLNIFAQQTNVDSKNPFTVYCTKDIGANLQPVAMSVVMDQLWNRVVRNFLAGRITYIYIDEVYQMFLQDSTAEFFFKLWKIIRKFNGILTGITQNVEECLASLTARTMLSNSDFLLIMRQSPSDAAALADLLHISENQISFLKAAEPGSGLMKVSSAIVPFIDRFPKDTKLYQLINTNPREAKKS